MKLFGPSRKRSLETAWSYDAKGLIWRILPSETGRIVGEVRDLEKKKASFFCLHAVSGEVLWEDLSPGDDWWIGMEGASNGRLYLHGFAAPDLPGKKGILAVDLATGRTLWEDTRMQLESLMGTTLVSSQKVDGEKIYLQVDAASGRVIETRKEESLPESWKEPTTTPRGFEFSRLIRDPARRIPFWGKITPPPEGDSAEIVETDVYDVLGLCVRSGNALRQEIHVYRRLSQELVLRDVVYNETAGFMPDSFFVQDSLLYYAIERKVLSAIRLSSPEAAL